MSEDQPMAVENEWRQLLAPFKELQQQADKLW